MVTPWVSGLFPDWSKSLKRPIKQGRNNFTFPLCVESRQSRVLADERRASNPKPAKTKMKTERQIRLESELNKVNAADLNRPMYDLNEDVISNLVSEAGYSSAKSYINDGNGWSKTLAATIEDLVNSIFALDGQTYETTAEVEAAAKSL